MYYNTIESKKSVLPSINDNKAVFAFYLQLYKNLKLQIKTVKEATEMCFTDMIHSFCC
jgi:hypothetical protein